MAITSTDLLLGKVGDRAQDGSTFAAPQLGLSLLAWRLLVAMLPLTTYSGGGSASCVLTGGAATTWASLGTTAQQQLLASGFVSLSGTTLTVFVMGFQGFGGIQGTTWLNWSFSYTNADASALYTVPAATTMTIYKLFWLASTSFTGGTSSAIGLSSNNAAASTKGDLLGGASGDVAATLVAGTPGGTAGPKLAAGPITLVAGDIVRFDRITSAFTAGAGIVIAQVALVT